MYLCVHSVCVIRNIYSISIAWRTELEFSPADGDFTSCGRGIAGAGGCEHLFSVDAEPVLFSVTCLAGVPYL